MENLDVNTLIKEHLEECDYKICGYWDEQDNSYEEITLPRSLEAELISSSASVTNKEHLGSIPLLHVIASVTKWSAAIPLTR